MGPAREARKVRQCCAACWVRRPDPRESLDPIATRRILHQLSSLHDSPNLHDPNPLRHQLRRIAMPDALYCPYRDGPLRSGNMIAKLGSTRVSRTTRNLRHSPLPWLFVSRLRSYWPTGCLDSPGLVWGRYAHTTSGEFPTYFARGNRVLVTRVHPIAGVEFRGPAGRSNPARLP